MENQNNYPMFPIPVPVPVPAPYYPPYGHGGYGPGYGHGGYGPGYGHGPHHGGHMGGGHMGGGHMGGGHMGGGHMGGGRPHLAESDTMATDYKSALRAEIEAVKAKLDNLLSMI